MNEPPIETTRRKFDTPQQEAYLNLWRTYDRVRAIEDELFSRYDLTAQQYNALRLLRAHPEGLPTLALAARLVSRAPDITRLLDRLAEQGLVARVRPSDNRRQVLVSITPAGQQLLVRLDEPVRECGHSQLGHLSEGDLRELTRLLRLARGPHEDVGSVWRDSEPPHSD